MKLSVGVTLAGADQNPELRLLVTKLKRTVQERGQIVRWTPVDLWHVMLVHLGQTKQERMATIINEWRPKQVGTELAVAGVGAYPSAESARVVWLGISETQAFFDLRSDLLDHITAGGIPVEAPRDRAHLPLGRFRNAIGAQRLIELGGRKKFGKFPLEEVILFGSVLQANIIKTTPLRRWPIIYGK